MGRTRNEKIMLQAVDETLKEYVSPALYCIGSRSEGRTCLVSGDLGWFVLFYERGQDREPKTFSKLLDACLQLIKNVINTELIEDADNCFRRKIAEISADKEERILQFLTRAMDGAISKYGYSILHAQEESTCLNKRDKKWVVSHYERGADQPIAEYDDLRDACIVFMDEALPGPRWQKNKEWFIEQTKDI